MYKLNGFMYERKVKNNIDMYFYKKNYLQTVYFVFSVQCIYWSIESYN